MTSAKDESEVPAYDQTLIFELAEFTLLYDLMAQASMRLATRRRQAVGARIIGGDNRAVAQRARRTIGPAAYCHGKATRPLPVG